MLNARNEYRLADLGCGNVQQCWLEEGVLASVQAITKDKGRLVVDAIDLPAPPSFEYQGICFTGFSLDDYSPRGKILDGILWRYPRPYDIIDLSGGRTKGNNSLDTALSLITDNLKSGGDLFFETDMANCAWPHMHEGFLMVVQEFGKAGLVEMPRPFQSQNQWDIPIYSGWWKAR